MTSLVNRPNSGNIVGRKRVCATKISEFSHSVSSVKVLVLPKVTLRTVPTNKRYFFLRCVLMQEMWILTSPIEIQKENWG